MRPEEVALSFVNAINAHVADDLAELMTEDHVFIDSDGTEVAGRQVMCEGWKDYFTMVPDFKVQVQDTFSRDSTVVLVGTSEGTFSEDGTLRPQNHWSVPAAWRATIDGTKVAVWQVYVNPEPMRAILDSIEA